MNRLKSKTETRILRKNRIRSVVSGTSQRPRLSVNISIKHVSAQIVDDTTHKTLVYATTVGLKGTEKDNMTEKAVKVGAEIAKKAKTAKIAKVVFDRSGRLYHGRVKALADAARENGLEF